MSPSATVRAAVARRAPLLLALLLAGCSADDFLQPPADGASEQAAHPAPKEKEGEDPAMAETPSVVHVSDQESEGAKDKEDKPPAKAEKPPADRPSEKPSDDAAKDKEGESKDKAEKPRPPHTVLQALGSYWRKLCSHPCARGADEQDKDKKNGKGSNGAEDKDKKANGDKDKKTEEKGKSDKEKNGPNGSEDKGKKSPPAGGEGNEKKDEKDESGKEKNDKDEKKDDKDEKKDEKEESKETWFSAHTQATMDLQGHAPFPALYTGARSLLPIREADTSLTATLFLDFRLWECGGYSGELVFDPELAGGRGFSAVDGIAGFSNGDITRVGVVEPTPYFARLFLRQTWGLGGEQETVEDEPNQIAGKRDIDRITLTVGKFTFTDLIDNNRYSHDPRTQMQNWSLMYNGAWDYPANVRGYDYGIGLDFNQKDWALRYGIMAEPAVANGAPIDPHFLKAFGQALEWEGRWRVCDHPGRVRLMAYLNRAHMGDYREALQEMPVDPDVTQTRDYRFKYGYGMNCEQELARDLGVWGRLGWSDGHTETWAFTPIDRTAALGLLLKGRCWARPNDEVGLAGVCNGLAKDHRDYLAAGGLDFSVGDGALNYRPEEIIEVYYRVAIVKGIYATADFQEICNPAYNHDRGPVSVESLMVHLEY
ncbi:MAG TPA: carbohydrate porin [Gemmataceae bacterium]|nr:carbohydrate porin [Gemmataceae bacterium]